MLTHVLCRILLHAFVLNKSNSMYYNVITKLKCGWKMETVTQWKLSSAYMLRYIIINNPETPYALYQDQTDKTP